MLFWDNQSLQQSLFWNQWTVNGASVQLAEEEEQPCMLHVPGDWLVHKQPVLLFQKLHMRQIICSSSFLWVISEMLEGYPGQTARAMSDVSMLLSGPNTVTLQIFGKGRTEESDMLGSRHQFYHLSAVLIWVIQVTLLFWACVHICEIQM